MCISCLFYMFFSSENVTIVRALSPITCFLVVGFNPFEKYARQNGNLPQIGVKIKNYFKPTLTFSPLKMDAWNTTVVSFWGPAYFQVRTVSFRECAPIVDKRGSPQGGFQPQR